MARRVRTKRARPQEPTRAGCLPGARWSSWEHAVQGGRAGDAAAGGAGSVLSTLAYRVTEIVALA
jgi:hypothetical protein